MSLQVTTEGLHRWTQSVFEKVGWMILAKKEANTNSDATLRSDMQHKVDGFVAQLKNLRNAIKDKINLVKEVDRQNDLLIELEKIVVLERFFKDNIQNNSSVGNQSGGAKKVKKSSKKATKK